MDGSLHPGAIDEAGGSRDLLNGLAVAMPISAVLWSLIIAGVQALA